VRRTTEKSSGAIRESCSQCAENRQFRSLDSDSKIVIGFIQEKRVCQPVYSTFLRRILYLGLCGGSDVSECGAVAFELTNHIHREACLLKRK